MQWPQAVPESTAPSGAAPAPPTGMRAPPQSSACPRPRHRGSCPDGAPGWSGPTSRRTISACPGGETGTCLRTCSSSSRASFCIRSREGLAHGELSSLSVSSNGAGAGQPRDRPDCTSQAASPKRPAARPVPAATMQSRIRPRWAFPGSSAPVAAGPAFERTVATDSTKVRTWPWTAWGTARFTWRSINPYQHSPTKSAPP
mmetsp:Transcript_38545/g.107402  ORF Transcript_38545/g.107402 Transcript_38545/m.107402 type:complete len:201 (+) Transcript_38545:27-629(+)